MTDARPGEQLAGSPAQLQAPAKAAGLIIPATALRSKPRHFKADFGRTANENAFRAGQFLLATVYRQPKALRFCHEQGIVLDVLTSNGPSRMVTVENGQVQLAAHNEVIGSQGGFLVFPEFEATLIDLREKYGIIRSLLRPVPMSSDTLTQPRRTAGLTAYRLTDNEAITASTKGWDQVTWTAKKIGVLTKLSSELNEDAVINVADDLSREIAYAFAVMEDGDGINGDGTSTYMGINGLRNRLLDVDGAGTDSAGLSTTAGATWASITLAELNALSALLPQYAAEDPDCCWLVSRQFYAAVMERLALAAGGVIPSQIAAGYVPRMLGYPVKFSPAMPTTSSNSQLCALLGAFHLAGGFGDRRATTIMMSEHSSFANDQIDIRGTERYDIVIHDAGTSAVVGPYVGLMTHS
jgi:HK97 family phage major capsid protein